MLRIEGKRRNLIGSTLKSGGQMKSRARKQRLVSKITPILDGSIPSQFKLDNYLHVESNGSTHIQQRLKMIEDKTVGCDIIAITAHSD